MVTSESASGSLPFIVRRATADDASSIASILHEAFTPYEPQYSANAFAATVPELRVIRARWHEGPVWVVLQGEAIVGTVAAVLKDDGAYRTEHGHRARCERTRPGSAAPRTRERLRAATRLEASISQHHPVSR